MNRPWSPGEIEIVRAAWLGEGNFKSCLRLLDNRTYAAASTYAKRRLNLGPRPHSDRGVPAYAWDMVMAELKKSPSTSPELIEKTGLSEAAVCKQLRLSKPGKRGKTHIVDWRRRSTGGSPVAIYAIGPGENAPMPAPYTNAEKIKATRLRRGTRKTCMNSKRINPFASAAGLVEAPRGEPGRVYIHLTDSKDDEFAEEMECAA